MAIRETPRRPDTPRSAGLCRRASANAASRNAIAVLSNCPSALDAMTERGFAKASNAATAAKRRPRRERVIFQTSPAIAASTRFKNPHSVEPNGHSNPRATRPTAYDTPAQSGAWL